MIIEILTVITILLLSVVLHEYAHGWVAFKLGDPTAKMAGRLNLNPLKHIDPVGTIVVPIVLRMMGFVPLGWAKPVPVNFANLHNPKKDMMWVGLAGPLTNFMVAVLGAQALKVPFFPGIVKEILALTVFINLILGVFNLIPIPPLDGSRVVMSLLPRHLEWPYRRIEPFGFVVIILLLNFGFLDFLSNIVQYMAVYLGLVGHT